MSGKLKVGLKKLANMKDIHSFCEKLCGTLR